MIFQISIITITWCDEELAGVVAIVPRLQYMKDFHSIETTASLV